jgi:hypothetical protein
VQRPWSEKTKESLATPVFVRLVVVFLRFFSILRTPAVPIFGGRAGRRAPAVESCTKSVEADSGSDRDHRNQDVKATRLDLPTDTLERDLPNGPYHFVATTPYHKRS